MKQPCRTCGGQGIVPHEKRRMGNGEVDPTDFHTHDVCTICGGGGLITVNRTMVEEAEKPAPDEASQSGG